MSIESKVIFNFDLLSILSSILYSTNRSRYDNSENYLKHFGKRSYTSAG